MEKTEKKTSDYSKIELGEFSGLGKNVFQPSPDFKLDGKVFVKDDLGLTSSEISFNLMQPGDALPFLHKHKENEEIYLAIKGQGQMLLNDEYVDMKEGSIIRVATDTERAIRNNSSEPFTFLVFQAKENSLEGSNVSDGYGIEKKPNWN